MQKKLFRTVIGGYVFSLILPSAATEGAHTKNVNYDFGEGQRGKSLSSMFWRADNSLQEPRDKCMGQHVAMIARLQAEHNEALLKAADADWLTSLRILIGYRPPDAATKYVEIKTQERMAGTTISRCVENELRSHQEGYLRFHDGERWLRLGKKCLADFEAQHNLFDTKGWLDAIIAKEMDGNPEPLRRWGIITSNRDKALLIKKADTLWRLCVEKDDRLIP